MSLAAQESYDQHPYPNVPLAATPTGLYYTYDLFKASLVTAQYARTRTVVSTEGTHLLNAGCGSGWETLVMAEANPGAHTIIGIDVSSKSVQVAAERLRFHGYTNAECYTLDIADLDQLGYQFDFISCSDVLFVLDSPLAGLQALQSVLKPHGIIWANLHCYHQRRVMLEFQEIFRLLDLNQLANSEALHRFRQFMEALIPAQKSRFHWHSAKTEPDQWVFNNYLLWPDKAFTIPDTLNMLQESGLALVRLVDQESWDLATCFTEMPTFVAQALEQLDHREHLYLKELIDPPRLIDFWASQSGSQPPSWTSEDWLQGTVQFNPLLIAQAEFHNRYDQALQSQKPLQLKWWLASPRGRLSLPYTQLVWLQPLLVNPTPVSDLIHGAQHSGLDPTLIDPTSLIAELQSLERYLILFLSH